MPSGRAPLWQVNALQREIARLKNDRLAGIRAIAPQRNGVDRLCMAVIGRDQRIAAAVGAEKVAQGELADLRNYPGTVQAVRVDGKSHGRRVETKNRFTRHLNVSVSFIWRRRSSATGPLNQPSAQRHVGGRLQQKLGQGQHDGHGQQAQPRRNHDARRHEFFRRPIAL